MASLFSVTSMKAQITLDGGKLSHSDGSGLQVYRPHQELILLSRLFSYHQDGMVYSKGT